jgi:hypothetical protein
MVVSQEDFKRICMCETAKDAWKFLEVTHECTKIIKNYRLQMSTTRFEKIRMKEDEMFECVLCLIERYCELYFQSRKEDF